MTLLIVAAGVVAAYLLFQWLGTRGNRGRYRIDGLVVRVLGPPVSLMVALVSVNYALYRRALARFDEAGIEISFPQRVVHLQEQLALGTGHTDESG